MKRVCLWWALAVSCLTIGVIVGANNQPLLTGSGKVVFPETTPSANLSASGGALTVASGGTNQSISFVPGANGIVHVVGGTVGSSGVLLDNGGAFRQKNVAGTVRGLLSHFTDDVVYLDDLDGPIEVRPAGGVYIFDSTGLSLGTGATATYRVDASGDINASGVYRQAGTSGTSATYTFPCSGSVTSSGGIVTAGVNSSGGVTGALGLSLTTQVIQYKDWASVNQTATVVVNVTITANGFTNGCRTF